MPPPHWYCSDLNWVNPVDTCVSVGAPPAGAVVYRIPLTWGQNKLPWKILHAALMLIALLLSIVGLCAVFDFHNAQHIANIYSIHSWIGITAAALFALQVYELHIQNNFIGQMH